MRGADPVVLAITRLLEVLKPAAISLVTEDFPLEPFTWIRMGTLLRATAWERFSIIPAMITSARSTIMKVTYPPRSQ
jgi:hypothetical protein